MTGHMQTTAQQLQRLQQLQLQQQHDAMFLRRAVAHKLSAGAILLWQQIYLLAQAQGQYTDLELQTAELQSLLGMSRTGLQRVRRALTAAGLLMVRMDRRQRMYYTLTFDGQPIATAITDCLGDCQPDYAGTQETDTNHPQQMHRKKQNKQKKQMHRKNQKKQMKQKKQVKQKQSKQNKENKQSKHTSGTHIPNAEYSADILGDGSYGCIIDAFCQQHDTLGHSSLYTRLQQFLHRRKQRGKTLTRAGLDALLQNLVRLAGDNVRAMVQIIEQSLHRGWSGFYPYQAQHQAQTAPPSDIGAHRNNAYHGKPTNPHHTAARIPKYDTKIEELDYLEW